MKILYDVIDIALMRFKPLAAYQYPLPHVLAVLAALSLANSPLAQDLQLDLAGRTLFLFGLNLAMYLAMARFFQYWLRLPVGQARTPLTSWDGQGSLLTFMILAQGVDFLAPVQLWLDPQVGLPLQLLLKGYGLVILVRGLAQTTGAPMRIIIGGLILCLPMLTLIFLLALSMALNAGWLDTATLEAARQAAEAAASAPR